MLWAEAKGAVKPQGRRRRGRAGRGDRTPTLREHNARRARTLVQEQQYSRAAQALTSAGMAPANRDTIRVMRNKHPFQEPPQPSEGDPEKGPAVLSPSEVFQAVKQFKAGSAPGPSGLRAALTFSPPSRSRAASGQSLLGRCYAVSVLRLSLPRWPPMLLLTSHPSSSRWGSGVAVRQLSTPPGRFWRTSPSPPSSGATW